MAAGVWIFLLLFCGCAAVIARPERYMRDPVTRELIETPPDVARRQARWQIFWLALSFVVFVLAIATTERG